MKKNNLIKYLYFLLIITTIAVTPNVYAKNRAYSVGAKWVNETKDDFTVNVKNASNAYGWLANYDSYYSLQPDFNYMKGSRLGTSQIYFINGHGSADVIQVYAKDSANYRTGISRFNDGYTYGGFKYAGLNGRSMSGTKLITFAGCSTARTYTNITNTAVDQGAKCAVGFKDPITSRFYDGPNWLKKYNNVLGNGYSVQHAINSAVTSYPNCDLSTHVQVRGNSKITLGTLAKSVSKTNYYSSNMQNVTKEELEFLIPIEDEYLFLDYNDDITIDFSNMKKDDLNLIIKYIKSYDKYFDKNNYKLSYNAINAESGYGYIMFTYYINGKIETNKVYLVQVDNFKIKNILFAGVKKNNIKNIGLVNNEKLIDKVNNFERNEKSEKIMASNDSNIFKSRSILTNDYSLDKKMLKENIIKANEKYFYDYNSNELKYNIDFFETDGNIVYDGQSYQHYYRIVAVNNTISYCFNILKGTGKKLSN